MIKSDIKQSLRQMAARKTTTFIQIIGLGIGLGSVIVMLVFILHEYSFDKYHQNSHNIYRVVYDKDCGTPYVMGESFKEEIPEIKNTFRIYNLWNVLIKSNDEFVKANDFILADSSIFSMLNIPILEGNKKFLHQNNNDIVISDRTAIKYFGDKNPVGQPLEISISGKIIACNVSGVFKRFPSNSSIQSEFIGSSKLAEYALGSQTLMFTSGKDQAKKESLDRWAQREFQTFLLIPENKSISAVEKKATIICFKQDKENKQKKIHLQSFTSMYFHSEDLWNYLPFKVSNVKTIRLFEGIAILLLLIAWFNYMLLSTAETKSQLREITCRKIIGATPLQIAGRAYIQSMLVALLSLIPALLFINIVIPLFNQFFDKNINLRLLWEVPYVTAIIGITLITGFAGGSYISFYTARLKPVNLFKPSNKNKTSGRLTPSGGPVVFQFIVFMLLFIAAIFIDKQVKYAEGKDQGFNSQNVLIFNLNNQELRNKVDIIRSKLETNAHVLKVATSAFTPPSTGYISLALGDDKNSEPLKEEGMFVGTDLIELLQIPVLEGSTFRAVKDNSNGIIINESAAQKFKVKAGDPLGSFKIKGILKDFHIHSFYKSINPLFIVKMNDEGCHELVVRSDSHDKEIIAAAKKIWIEILPTSLFEYQLLNDRISSFYVDEKKQVKTISFFSFLAIFLSIMGLLGYVSITLLKRTKEIGIRKVNGAKVSEVLATLNKDFIKWVVIAFIIACPLSWYAMHKWLQNFAYKTDLSWWVFALAGLVAVAVAVLTVSWQSWRAATRNPVESLRYE